MLFTRVSRALQDGQFAVNLGDREVVECRTRHVTSPADRRRGATSTLLRPPVAATYHHSATEDSTPSTRGSPTPNPLASYRSPEARARNGPDQVFDCRPVSPALAALPPPTVTIARPVRARPVDGTRRGPTKRTPRLRHIAGAAYGNSACASVRSIVSLRLLREVRRVSEHRPLNDPPAACHG